MRNVLINAAKKGYLRTMLGKLMKRFEKDTSREAAEWARSNVSASTEDFCRSIDSNLYDQVRLVTEEIRQEGSERLSNLPFSLGGGGNYEVLYFLIRKTKPRIIVETGVAAGWSSLSILRALRENGEGKLYSSDFPYFRLENPEKYVGYLAKNEVNYSDWFLDIRGDSKALPEIVSRISNLNIDLIHYDSDKSYSGRVNAMRALNSNISSDTIIIFDDIQDNLHFRDFVIDNKKEFHVLEFEGKYLGIVGV